MPRAREFIDAKDDLGALVYLQAAVERQDVPREGDARLDPQLAAQASRTQHLIGQTRGRIFSQTNEPKQLDAALDAYHEAVRTSGRSPHPDILVEAMRMYRAHGAHEGTLHLAAHIIQEHPSFHGLGDVVLQAIACLVQLKQKVPGQYVQWLCEMPQLKETDALMLTARAKEARGKIEVAREGFREIFLTLQIEKRDAELLQSKLHLEAEQNRASDGKPNPIGDCDTQDRDNSYGDESGSETKSHANLTTMERIRRRGKNKKALEEIDSGENRCMGPPMDEPLIGNHKTWELWIEDANTWIKAARVWFDMGEYELSNVMLMGALERAANPGDECWSRLCYGHAMIGHTEAALRYFKKINKGRFQRDLIGYHRKFPKWAKVSFRPGSNRDIMRRMLENVWHIRELVIDEAFKLDDREREKENMRGMKKAETDMRWFLTEERIWNACVTIGCYMRMWLAQAELRRRRRAVTTIQSAMRVFLVRQRINRIRSLLHLTGMIRAQQLNARLSGWNAQLKFLKTTAVAASVRRISTLMAMRKMRIMIEVRRRAVRMRRIIDVVPVVKLAWLRITQRRILQVINDEKERRSACLIQRMFRSRLMKQLFLVLRGSGVYPNRALSIWYRDRLTGMSKMLLEKRLTPYAQKIENNARRFKAQKLAKKLRRQKALDEFRRRKKEEAAARRRKANEDRRKRKKAEVEAALRAKRRQIAKDLLGQLSNPVWEKLQNLLEQATVALGEDHNLVVRGRRLSLALEKESAHKRYLKVNERGRVMRRARRRGFESVEKELDIAFVEGRLDPIPLPPQSPEPNWQEMLMQSTQTNSIPKKTSKPECRDE